MSRTARTYLLFVTFVVLLGAVLVGALAQIPDLPAAQAADVPAPVEVPAAQAAAQAADVPAPVEAPAQVEASAPVPASSFGAELVGPGRDLSPEHADVLAELAHRYCVTVVAGQIPPGADVQTREDWIATLTLPEPSLTTGWSLEEAERFLDLAGAHCADSQV